MGKKNVNLILVLGDQLTLERGALSAAKPSEDVVVMAEVFDEASYVRHNRHKIVLIFAAMRHFRDQLRSLGFEVLYYELGEGVASLPEALQRALECHPLATVCCCEPGEYRLREVLQH